jgi:hypothetical protein
LVDFVCLIILSYNPFKIVPTYDARFTDFDFDTDLPTIRNKLPPWDGDIPSGAFVVVGYSPNSFSTMKQGNRNSHLGCNLLWVMVCGTR